MYQCEFKRVYAWLWDRLCLCSCSGQLVAEQKVSAWWAVWADFGIHREKQHRAKDTSQAGAQGCMCVWEREIECGSFNILLVKVCFIHHKKNVLLTVWLWVDASWSRHNDALCPVSCAGIRLPTVPCTQEKHSGFSIGLFCSDPFHANESLLIACNAHPRPPNHLVCLVKSSVFFISLYLSPHLYPLWDRGRFV